MEPLTETITHASSGSEERGEPATDWRRALLPYTESRLARSLADLATSVLPYLVLMVAIGFALRVSVVLALVLAVPAAGFLIRTFIVYHDCAHSSFLRSRRANAALGNVLGVLVWIPFQRWRHEHAIHHATAGDLDRRGTGDIWTLTVAEYRDGPLWRRVAYRLCRNPLLMFGLGWILVVLVKPRLILPSDRPRVRANVIATNLALVAIGTALSLTLGWQTYLLLQLPTLALTGAVGIWMFYVQHQFESTYWEDHDAWGYDEAALHGSSYLRLPRILQFFTGNIGLHHVHHLSPRIPNYNLQSAHDRTPGLQAVPTLTLRDAMGTLKLKLWDEERHKLVSFKDGLHG